MNWNEIHGILERAVRRGLARHKASLGGFWETLSKEQLAAVEAVAMDVWDPYVASARKHLPESDQKIVYDKYHIAAHLSKAVDQVRRASSRHEVRLGAPGCGAGNTAG